MRGLARVVFLVLPLLIAADVVAPSPVVAHVRQLSSPEAPPPANDVPVAAAAPARVNVASAAPTPMPRWLLLAGLALAGVAVAAAPARGLRVGLVLLLAVFATETGVHSVHHLADQQAATQCVVALVSAHVHGASLDAPAATSWVATPVGIVVVADAVTPGAAPLRPDEGRAPPAA